MITRMRRVGGSKLQLSIDMPTDEGGFLGRECPAAACEGYFTVKLGTGLEGENLPCHCPYCGHSGSFEDFWTKDQIKYAESIAFREFDKEVRRKLKSLEFDHKPKGAFGIGVSMKLSPSRPRPIRHYREKRLETVTTCDRCALEYAVYGLFAFCPDCRTHNSLQILRRNLALTCKQVALSGSLEDEEFAKHLLEDALENCVSAFDGFGRETVRINASKSTDEDKVAKLSFQNLEVADANLKSLFSIDLRSALSDVSWKLAIRSFHKRHLLAHRSGVMDEKYRQQSGDPVAIVGRRVTISENDVTELADTLEELGEYLVSSLERIP